MADFTSRHVGNSHVLLSAVEADRKSLHALGVPPCEPATAPDVVIHDRDRDWLFPFDAVHSRRHMDKAMGEKLAILFAPCSKVMVFFSAFEDRDSFSRFAESIVWETQVWIADEPDHMIHYNGERLLGPYPA